VQVFDVAQIKLNDPNNDTLAIYGIQSANKARVELFGADIAENTILSKTQHGYATADGKIRLQKSKRGWKLHQAK
jgi:putative lipoprotein